MPKIMYMQPSIFMTLYAEAQQWEDGFALHTPDPQPTIFASELIFEHYELPCSNELTRERAEMLIEQVRGDNELSECDGNERPIVEATGVALQPMDPTNVVEPTSEDVPS